MTIPNAGYAPWIIEGRGGITVSQTGVRVVIDGSGAGGLVEPGIETGQLLVWDNVAGVWEAHSDMLLLDQGGALRLAPDAARTGVLFQQEDATVGNGADTQIQAQTTLDVNGNGGNLVLRSGDGGLNAGDVDIATFNSESSLFLGEDGNVALQGTGGGTTSISAQGGGRIELDTTGVIQFGQGATVVYEISGIPDAAIGAQVDSWTVEFNGVTRKIPIHAVA